jgi:hypothetical protein
MGGSQDTREQHNGRLCVQQCSHVNHKSHKRMVSRVGWCSAVVSAVYIDCVA